MNDDKSLSCTVKATIHQREKLVDKIQFLIPSTYGDINLQDSVILLKYIDQGNIPHAERLIMDEELYKEDFIRCVMDVDTNLTRFAGDIKICLSFLMLNGENGLHEEVMHSGETIISIVPLDDYFAFVPDDSLQVIDKVMVELEAKLKATNSILESCEKLHPNDSEENDNDTT
jgi:hypothetical protein